MRKHIIITRYLEFGGSNKFLELLIYYLGKKNITIIIDDDKELEILKSTYKDINLNTKLENRILHKPNFNNINSLSTIKEITKIIFSILYLIKICLVHRTNKLTISSIDPEKHIYLFWIPFININYFLHSEPINKGCIFTSYTCNKFLGNKKKIITVSHSNKNILIKNWNIKKSKYNDIILINNTTMTKKPKVKHKLDINENIIITMGHVTDYKNPYLWLEVAKTITDKRKDTKFYWLGNGPLLSEFQEKTKYDSNINFIGHIKHTQEYLIKATLYYQPSISETQGIAVIEAMANKIPCIVSNAGGLPESIENGKNGIVVKYNDIKENTEAIDMLLDNKPLQQFFANQSYNRYLEKYSYNSFKKNMDLIYTI